MKSRLIHLLIVISGNLTYLLYQMGDLLFAGQVSTKMDFGMEYMDKFMMKMDQRKVTNFKLIHIQMELTFLFPGVIENKPLGALYEILKFHYSFLYVFFEFFTGFFSGFNCSNNFLYTT